MGCHSDIGLLRKDFYRYCQPNGSFDLNFDNAQNVFFSIDGEPLLLRELHQIRFSPMQPIKDMAEEDDHTILIVRGALPRLVKTDD